MGVEIKSDAMSSAKLAKKMPPPPPPPPRRSWSSSSVTRREIEKFWRKKRLVEEEHFLASIKAAARLRASRLSEEDYLLFLEENKIIEEDGVCCNRTNHTQNKGSALTVHQEIRVGIKDWWTKSKYAYLNQPAVGSTGRQDRRSNYIPNNFYFCSYSNYSPVAAATVSSQAQAKAQAQSQAPPPYLGVF